jgi:hypothetical protein
MIDNVSRISFEKQTIIRTLNLQVKIALPVAPVRAYQIFEKYILVKNILERNRISTIYRLVTNQNRFNV